MNKLKRTLALVACMAISATAFVGCGDEDSSSSSESSKAEDSAASDASSDDASTPDDGGDAAPEMTLKTGGGKLTILAWNANDVDPMLSFWKPDNNISDDQVDFINYNCGGGEASAKYDQKFLSGEDVDLFMVEADWALKYIKDDSLTAPMSALGFADSDFDGQYPYTMDIGKDANGVIKGVSWQAAPGAWCYRSDLAESYLGVKSPEEMQAKVGSWDAFQEAGKAVSEASGGKTAITSTLGGIWQAFAANRTTPWVKDGALAVDDFCDTFIDLAKNMRDNGYVTEISQWSPEWYAAGQTDDTMGYFVSTWGFGDAILLGAAGGNGGATYGKWACTEGPAPFFWGGTWMCVSPNTDDADLAKSFIEYFTVNEETMKKYALGKEGGEYVNNINVMQSIVDEGSNKNDNLGGQDQFAVVHENAKKINLNGLITEYDSTIKEKFVNAVDSYCKGEVDSKDACLEKFKDDVAAAVPEIVVD